MKLFRHPNQVGDGPTNMAFDAALLALAPHLEGAVLRWYGWDRPAFSFGYTQTWAEALERAAAEVPGADPASAVVRRPSGGGWVDHRASWTYALVLPAMDGGTRLAPRSFYCKVHTALVRALAALGVPAALAPETTAVPGVCFLQAVTSDVVDPVSQVKIAGAALKRTRDGLLCQGSVRLPGMTPDGPGECPPPALADAFAEALVTELGLDSLAVGGVPTEFLQEFLVRQVAERRKFGSMEWNERR